MNVVLILYSWKDSFNITNVSVKMLFEQIFIIHVTQNAKTICLLSLYFLQIQYTPRKTSHNIIP